MFQQIGGERYRGFAKLAYPDGKPVGLIQYLPKPDEKLVEITCIFVLEEENLRKGISKALLHAIMDEMRKPKPYLNDEAPLGLVTWAFQVPGRYPQHEFYRKMGFKQASGDDPFLLYYPLREGFVYAPKDREYVPQEVGVKP